MIVSGLHNKIYQLFCYAFIFAYVFTGIELYSHGFAQGTLVKASEDCWWSI